jgi:glucose-6-phosphate isomerase, archaeal
METPGEAGLNDCVTTPVFLDWCSGKMTGKPVQESFKTLDDLKRVFGDSSALSNLEPSREIYRVRWWSPMNPGTEGGLFWGLTLLQPGKVGDEYFMTHGHSHANPTRAEFYGTVSGSGMLIQMNAERRTWGETMTAGSLHYVRGENAHRIANTGSVPLIVWACWPTDAGYDYESIAERGFSARLVERDGKPVLIAAE